MIGNAFDALGMLKEYGLAGVLAWMFWWTLRRMMASHDATIRGLRDQLEAQAEASRGMGDSFMEVVQNHLGHVSDALARFDANLSNHADEQRQWQGRLLEVLEGIAARLPSRGKRGEARKRAGARAGSG
jgi:hypothetical protein